MARTATTLRLLSNVLWCTQTKLLLRLTHNPGLIINFAYTPDTHFTVNFTTVQSRFFLEYRKKPWRCLLPRNYKVTPSLGMSRRYGKYHAVVLKFCDFQCRASRERLNGKFFVPIKYCRAAQELLNGCWIMGIHPGEQKRTTFCARYFLWAFASSMHKSVCSWMSPDYRTRMSRK
jgi:hypothetical protein